MIREQERWVQGCSLDPGKVALYSIPERWIINGRPGGKRSEDRAPVSLEEKVRRNTGRVISRYWSAVGWLWMRTAPEVIDLGGGRKLRHRQGFLTLTLPGVATADHKAVKAKVLDPFFTYCRNVLGLRDYVWTAELQERGEIHFHAIINQFLPKDKVRAAWLRACDASGIISSSGEGSRPATEVEECKSWKGSRIYAGKYLAKALQSGDIVGRVWSGSHSVTGIRSVTTNEVDQAFNVAGALSEVRKAAPRWRQCDHGISVARWDVGIVTRRRSPVLWRLFKDHLRVIDNPPNDDASTTQPPPARAYRVDPTTTATSQPYRKPSADRGQVDRSLSVMGSGVPCTGANAGEILAGMQGAISSQLAARVPSLWDHLSPERVAGLHPLALN